MNDDTLSERDFKTHKVKVVYEVPTFYAHCPACGRSRKCRCEDDGSFTLTCGCMRDGVNMIRHFIDASDIVERDDIRFRLIEVSDEYPSKPEWR